MTEKKQWKRPHDVVTFRTSDPKQMLGKYMPKHAVKTWTEDFIDEDTGETVSVERNQIVVGRGYISQEKLAEIQFAIQAGDIQDVEVSEEDVLDMTLYTPSYLTNFMVEISILSDAGSITKNHFAVRAQTIPQAIQIAAEFGQMYRGFEGFIRATRVVTIDASIVPDDHACIPEANRKPADERKDYFKVQVRREWVEDMKLKKSDIYYIVAANDVGQAKERIALLLDIMKAEQEKKEGFKVEDDRRTTIRKAIPFEVDCIVPKEFSDLFYEKPTN